MSKNDFSNFEVGTMFNTVSLDSAPRLSYKNLTVNYPSRLEAMALDPGKIVENDNLVYEAGQINFSVDLKKIITIVALDKSSDITVSDRTKRKSLVMHAAKIMQQALGVEHGLHIDIEDEVDLRHCGLGSSSSLMAGTAASVNELYGRPISPLNISRFCAQNHGEEIEGNDNRLVPVQCIGGSAVCGHFEGGLVILAGQATPIYTLQLPLDKKVVIGVPSDFTHPDSEELMKAEIDNIAGFQSTGEVYGKKIAYRLVHEVLPGLVEGNLKPCKDLVFDYRWDMGSIGNCEFVYPGLTSLAEKMRWMKDDEDIDIISLSSVGPGFFAITPYSEKISEAFKSLGMQTITTGINNGKYSVEYGETI